MLVLVNLLPDCVFRLAGLIICGNFFRQVWDGINHMNMIEIHPCNAAIYVLLLHEMGNLDTEQNE